MQQQRYAHATTRITHDLLDGEVLAIEESTGTYYSMTGTAATVWVAIGGGRTVDEIVGAAAAHHGASADGIRDDIGSYLDELLTNGLVVVGDDGDSSGDAPPLDSIPAGPWEAPALGRFTDMRDLLMFDPVHEVDTTGWPNVER